MRENVVHQNRPFRAPSEILVGDQTVYAIRSAIEGLGAHVNIIGGAGWLGLYWDTQTGHTCKPAYEWPDGAREIPSPATDGQHLTLCGIDRRARNGHGDV